MKLSIITVNYNDAAGLSSTMASVFEQTWNDFEYIVIDGGSTDESVEILNKYHSKLSYWVSEADAGIYNAMNKGIGRAKGEYLLMLNSGDMLCDSEVLNKVFSSGIYNEDILAGDVYRAVNGKVFDKSFFPDNVTFSFLRNGTLSHQATFIKRYLHSIVGLYDESLKYSSDWKFFILAICRNNATYRHLPFFVATCDSGGLTCDPNNFLAMKRENENVLQENFSAFLADYTKFDLIQNNSFKTIFLKSWNKLKRYNKSFLKSIVG